MLLHTLGADEEGGSCSWCVLGPWLLSKLGSGPTLPVKQVVLLGPGPDSVGTRTRPGLVPGFRITLGMNVKKKNAGTCKRHWQHLTRSCETHSGTGFSLSVTLALLAHLEGARLLHQVPSSLDVQVFAIFLPFMGSVCAWLCLGSGPG